MRITVSRMIKRETQVFICLLVVQRRDFITNNREIQNSGYILHSNSHEAKRKYKGIYGSQSETQQAKDQGVVRFNIMMSQVDGIKDTPSFPVGFFCGSHPFEPSIVGIRAPGQVPKLVGMVLS